MTIESRKIPSLFLAAGLSLLLAGCATGAPPPSQVPDLSFEQYRPIPLRVAKVEIIDRFRAESRAGGAPHVELMMKQPPEQAVQELLRKVLVAGGASGTLRVYLDDASVTGEKLPVTEGLSGLFNNEPAERYHATVALHFELVQDDGVRAKAETSADRTKTVMKDASPAQRDMVFYYLDDELLSEVNHGLETVVRPAFGLYN